MSVQIVPTLAVGLALGLLMAAAWNDLALRVIPDQLCVLLAILGVAFRLHSGWIELTFSVFTSLLLFFLLFVLFTRGIVGGGDVKLAVAVALWLSPPDCYMFLVATALAGGALGLVHLVLRKVLAPALAAGPPTAGRLAHPRHVGLRIMRVELKRIAARQPLPYGVALAAGGGYTLLRTLGG